MPPAGLTHLVALLDYDGPARELVARLKYRNQRAALSWLADGLCAAVRADRTISELPVGAVTWAPTTRARARDRGFDQAALLARALARRLRLPAVELLRRLDGPPQTGRSARERREQPTAFAPHGATGWRGGVSRDQLAAGGVLLVDDVTTTGATLSAAAAALTSSGIAPVVGVVAARATAHPSRRAGELRS